ncbi:MAG: type IX secretion system protein PorQ [Bacteroidota bacterium]
MSKKLLLAFLFLTGIVSYGQVGGQSVYQFLNLVTSPRQAALGGKIVTIYDEDVNQVHFNPATINANMNNRLGLNYGSYYDGVTYGTASYAVKLNERINTLQAGVNYVNYGTFDGRDETGNATSSFTGSEIALSFGYSFVIPKTKIHIGTNAKLISSTLETYNSFGGAIDVGALYINEKEGYNYGFVIRNIGTQFSTYSGTNEKLPLEVMFGISKQLENVPIRWHLTLENLQQWNLAFSNPNHDETSIDGETTPEKISVFNNALRHVLIGAELFPKKGFNIRLGYNFRRGEELRLLEQRNFSGLSFGFGLKINKLKFNYSYSRYTLASNTSLFGLTINFQ